jgi:lipoprotein signal peptidase
VNNELKRMGKEVVMLILMTVFLPESVPFVVTELAIVKGGLGNVISLSLEGSFINVLLFFCCMCFDSYMFPRIHVCSPTQHRLVKQN